MMRFLAWLFALMLAIFVALTLLYIIEVILYTLNPPPVVRVGLYVLAIVTFMIAVEAGMHVLAVFIHIKYR